MKYDCDLCAYPGYPTGLPPESQSHLSSSRAPSEIGSVLVLVLVLLQEEVWLVFEEVLLPVLHCWVPLTMLELDWAILALANLQ